MPKWIRWTMRAAFAALLLFELANELQLTTISLEYTWLGLLVTGAFAWGALEWGDRYLRTRGRELHWAVWMIVFASACVDALGDVLHLYGRLPWYDQVAHILGAAVVTIAILAILSANRRAAAFTRADLALAVGISTIISNLYELEEYLEDVLALSSRLGDGPDTANDLLMNLLGSLVVISVVVWRQRFRHHKIIS